jgi:hypothetical protein
LARVLQRQLRENASVEAMKIRVLALLLFAACGHPGKMRVDNPTVKPYQKPDISEITGIDEDDDAGSGTEEKGSAAAPAPAPTPPAQPGK